MTRYLTKPRPGKPVEETGSGPETDKSKSKRGGKKQAPVEEVFEASSFSSSSEPESLREMSVTTKRKRGKQQQAVPVEEDIHSSSFSSSDEPDSLREMGFTNQDEPSRQSRDNTADSPNRESSNIPRPSARASQLQSPAETSIASQTRSAMTRRSMPASMAPPNNRPSAQSRRKSNSPLRKTPNKVYQDIRRLQNGTELVIPKLPFSRVIREVLQEYSHKDMRVTAECLKCLQEASEIYLTQLMEDGWRCTRHRDRATLTPKDLRLVLMLRNDSMLM